MEAICRKTFDRRIAVDIELGATLLQVLGDPTQLEQMLLNARDALQAVRQPAIHIAATLKRARIPRGRMSYCG